MRITLPFLEYLFIIVFFILCLRSFNIFILRENKKDLFRTYLRAYYLFIIVAFGYLTGLLFTHIFTKLILRETATVIFFLFIIFIIILYIESPKKLKAFHGYLLMQIKYIAIIAALLGIVKFILLLYGIKMIFLYQDGQYPIGTSLKLDHNFSALASILGLLLLLFSNKESFSKKKNLENIFATILTIQVIFSSSRRAFILLLGGTILLWLIYLVIHKIDKRLIENVRIKKIKMYNIWLYSSLTLVLILFNIFPVRYSYRIIQSFGMNRSIVKYQITSIIYDYSTIFTEDTNIDSLNHLLWKSYFNPLDPGSGWGTGIYKEVRKLTGDNVNIVPKRAIGYLIDRSSNYYSSNGNSYHNVNFQNLKLKENQIVSASVYCFVDSAFNGDLVHFYVGGSAFRKTRSNYDLTQKGKWQKLSVIASTLDESRKLSLNFQIVKRHSTDFDSLAGSTVIAYPNFTIQNFDPLNPDSGWGYLSHTTVPLTDSLSIHSVPAGTKGYLINYSVEYYVKKNNSTSATVLFMPFTKQDQRFSASVYCYVFSTFNGSSVLLGSNDNYSIGKTRGWYNLDKKGTWQKLEIEFRGKTDSSYVPVFVAMTKKHTSSFDSLNGYVIWAYPQLNMIKEINQISHPQKGEIQKTNTISIQSKNKVAFLNTDGKNIKMNSVLPFYNRSKKDSLSININENHLFGNRYVRWEYAYNYFENYTIIQKLFGKGFDYIPAFGEHFFRDKNHMDYPHNPIIASILYAGIFGGILYIIYLLQSICFYFRYIKVIMLFFIFYLITFFFSFFSGNSHFELPLFTFLSLVPFYTRYILHNFH